ncbi:MAG: hypothetical protein HQL06_10075 [Nitrospirae bacterium]|nr:hypothetical protein [Nitrospirota bacterium]MBF0344562.1 hypothetical protein [Nitrospirota bacterium]
MKVCVLPAVAPALAQAVCRRRLNNWNWIPAFAGMTVHRRTGDGIRQRVILRRRPT